MVNTVVTVLVLLQGIGASNIHLAPTFALAEASEAPLLISSTGGFVLPAGETATLSNTLLGYACNALTYGYQLRGGTFTALGSKPYGCTTVPQADATIGPHETSVEFVLILNDDTCAQSFDSTGGHALVTGDNPYEVDISDAGFYCEAPAGTTRPPGSSGNLSTTVTIAEIRADVPPPPQVPPEDDDYGYSWADCLYKKNPPLEDLEIVAVFHNSKDDQTQYLNCNRVRHIYNSHGFDHDTVDCIAKVLSAPNVDRRINGLPWIDDKEYRWTLEGSYSVGGLPWVFLATVITDRATGKVLTAFTDEGPMRMTYVSHQKGFDEKFHSRADWAGCLNLRGSGPPSVLPV